MDLTELERTAVAGGAPDGHLNPARHLSGLEPGGYCRQAPERDTMATTDERTAMTDFDIQVGGEPPESSRNGRGKYRAIAAEARAHPGEWVSVRGINRNVAGAIRAGSTNGFKPPTDWEVRNADTSADSSTATLWVKYIGKGEDA